MSCERRFFRSAPQESVTGIQFPEFDPEWMYRTGAPPEAWSATTMTRVPRPQAM
jgi:hypothetical protein